MARIQELNLDYMEQKDMAEIIASCFRKPKESENVRAINGKQMLEMMRKEYPSLTINHGTRISLGVAMKELGFERIDRAHVAFYKVVPLKNSMKRDLTFELANNENNHPKIKAA